MLQIANQFHDALQRFICAIDTAKAVAIDTEFSMYNVKIENPFLAQNEVFDKLKEAANAGRLLQIGFAAVYADNSTDTFTIYVNDNDNLVDMGNLRFLLSNGFDIYKYFKQQFRLGIDYDREVAMWNALISGYKDEERHEGKVWRESEDIVVKAKEMIAAGYRVDLEMHVSREWYFSQLYDLQGFFADKLGKKLLVKPILFTPSLEDKLYVHIAESTDDIKEQLMAYLRFVDHDIRHVTLVFDKIMRSNALVVGFSFSSDIMLLHNAILGRKLTDLQSFLVGISTMFPTFLDLQVALQHPLANKQIEKLQKQKKTYLRSRSLTGYYTFLTGTKPPFGAHDAGADAAMTLRVYQEINALYALQRFQLCYLKSLYNVISIFGSFTPLGAQPPNLYPLYPLYYSEKVKTPEAATRRAVDDLENVFANVVHGSRVGQIFIDYSIPVRPVRLSSIFNNQGKPRRFFGWLARDGLLSGEFGRVMTPSAARKLHDMLYEKK